MHTDNPHTAQRSPAAVLVTLFALGLLLAGLSGCSGDAAPNTPTSKPPMSVRVVHPEMQTLQEWDEYVGRFQPTERVQLRARVSGQLQSVHFKDGQQVDKDQLLYVIGQRPFQVAVVRATARYELAKYQFQRAESLRKNQTISESDYQQRLQEMRIEKAALEEAKLNLAFTEIRAPIAGRVGRNRVHTGNLVVGGTANATHLTTLLAQQPILFYFEVSESDVLTYRRLQENGERGALRDAGWPVFLKLQDEQAFVHEGHLDFANNELDLETGTMLLRASFDNRDGVLESGLFGRLRMAKTEPFEGVLIPDTAIGRDGARTFVYTLNQERKAEKRYLELGAIHDFGQRIIKSGLSAADQVVVGNLALIQPGMPLTPVVDTLSRIDD